jgi:uncharacterized alkaline shock family protein YloU
MLLPGDLGVGKEEREEAAAMPEVWSNGSAGAVPASSTEPPPVQKYHGPDATESSYQSESLGGVKISRRVLRTVVEQAALGVPGVSRMASFRNEWPHLLGRPLPQHGVGLTIRENAVALELYLIIQSGMSMVEVGTRVQEAVAMAVEHILGMEVSEINVYIQDVA